MAFAIQHGSRKGYSVSLQPTYNRHTLRPLATTTHRYASLNWIALNPPDLLLQQHKSTTQWNLENGNGKTMMAGFYVWYGMVCIYGW
jgi:hypothetical protein